MGSGACLTRRHLALTLPNARFPVMGMRGNERRRAGAPRDATGRQRLTYRVQVRNAANRVALPWFRLTNRGKASFECPVCGYRGPFRDLRSPTGTRQHAQCPRCGALERHRLQYLVLSQVLQSRTCRSERLLHFAPEPFFRDMLRRRFGAYETADIDGRGVDHRVDIQHLPFSAATYDVVFASHVLEHVQDDQRAISEVRRILRPGGLAILPVPIVAAKTIEYPYPNGREFGHVRAPGPDYFQRYALYFDRVETIASDSLPARFQLFVYEDRSRWPTEDCPWRQPMQGDRHCDFVPVCYVAH